MQFPYPITDISADKTIYRYIYLPIPITMFLGSCNTIDGPNPDKPCIFPFYWRGKTYNGKLLGIDRKFDLAELWPNFGRTF